MADEIFGNLLNKNSEEITPLNFYSKAQTNGDDDIKNDKESIYGKANSYDARHNSKTYFEFGGVLMTAEELGNFQYGILGRVIRLPEFVLLQGAGDAQIRDGQFKTRMANT